jgi:hypothetical protein
MKNKASKKQVAFPVHYLSEIGTKLMYGEPLTETEAHYLITIIPVGWDDADPRQGRAFSDLIQALYYGNGANLDYDQRQVLQVLLQKEDIRLWGND